MVDSKQFIDDLKIVENIPMVNGMIDASDPLDAEFFIEDSELAKRFGITGDSISFRQIINRFNEFLNKSVDMDAYLDVKKVPSGYPTEYLLFDYCLAALEGDLLDAKFYLAHAYRIMGFSRSINLILTSIVYSKLLDDKEIRKFLALLARSIEPMSAESHVESFGKEYQKRYSIYKKELRN